MLRIVKDRWREGTAIRGAWLNEHVTGVRNFAAPMFLTAAVLASCGGGEQATSSPAPLRAPVILISIDTLRSDRLSVYGYDDARTPAFDRFRQDAILYERAFSNVPLTLPSHATIFTGLAPYAHGVRDNIGYQLDDHPTLAERLAAAGYVTGGAVSSYVLRGETGISRGFSFWDDHMTEAPVDTISSWQRDGERTAEALRRWIDDHSSSPVFAFLHIYEPHYPYMPPEPFASENDDPYDGEVARADAILGSFLDSLRNAGLYDDALIVVLSDHGEGLGDHGELEHGVFLYREAIQVPLLIKLPNSERAGETVPSPVSLEDLYPTIVAAVTGEQPEAGFDILGSGLDPNRAIYAETYYPRLHYGWSELFSQIDGRYHLIDAPEVELYDYRADPGETTNIAQEDRRVAGSMRLAIRDIVAQHPFEQPRAADPEELAKLESLGYLGGGSSDGGDFPDPKEKIELLTEFGRGAAAFQRGELDRAIEIGRAIVRENPDFLQGWGLISSASRKKGDYSGALGALETQMERSPGNPQTALALSSVTYEMRRFDEARTYAELAMDYAPSIANEMIARIELARGDLDEAERAAHVAAQAAPSRIEPLMLASLVAHRRGDYAAELVALDQVRSRIAAGAADPVAELEWRRGQALLQLRQVPEAEAAFRSETSAFPDNRRAWVDLALVVGAQGRRAEADTILDRALVVHNDREMRRMVDEARNVMRASNEN